MLAEYAELKEKGLRKQALQKLNEFILFADKFTKMQKRKLVQLICQKYIELSQRFDHYYFQFDAQILTQNIIIPTLKKSIKDEPQNAEPLKYILLYQCNEDDCVMLELILSLTPKDENIRRLLIRSYLGHLAYAVHHLESDSGYIGYPTEDLKLCLYIEDHMKCIDDKDAQMVLLEELKKYRLLIQEYQEYRKSIKSFVEWRRSK